LKGLKGGRGAQGRTWPQREKKDLAWRGKERDAILILPRGEPGSSIKKRSAASRRWGPERSLQGGGASFFSSLDLLFSSFGKSGTRPREKEERKPPKENPEGGSEERAALPGKEAYKEVSHFFFARRRKVPRTTKEKQNTEWG